MPARDSHLQVRIAAMKSNLSRRINPPSYAQYAGQKNSGTGRIKPFACQSVRLQAHINPRVKIIL
jgi:hypothetical protein